MPYFMDRWQYVIAEQTGKTYGENGYGIPVFTYEEVAGLVLGYDPGTLDSNCIRWQLNPAG